MLEQNSFFNKTEPGAAATAAMEKYDGIDVEICDTRQWHDGEAKWKEKNNVKTKSRNHLQHFFRKTTTTTTTMRMTTMYVVAAKH